MTDLIALAKQAGASVARLNDVQHLTKFSSDELQAFAELIRADELEACAALCAIEPLGSCNQIERSLWIVATELCGEAIRSRTTT